nr:tRNA 2-thiocytidine(32) synthetase TtcA [Candidatus Kinetoplastibacterium sorsogonicusi]
MQKISLIEKQYSDKNYINIKKLNKKISRDTTKAISDFNMIEDGDLVMVCMSGGKDSYALLDILQKIKLRAPFNFELIAVNLDQGQPNFPKTTLPTYLKEKGIKFHIEEQNTYNIVNNILKKNETKCSLCSRLRRGILYKVADKLGANKIALGHHMNDIINTFFLNMLYNGKLKSMPPKLLSDNGKHIVIRPLSYILEKDLEIYSKLNKFPIIPCYSCGTQKGLKRKEINKMINYIYSTNPGKIFSIFNSLSNISPSHMLDRNLFNFETLSDNS